MILWLKRIYKEEKMATINETMTLLRDQKADEYIQSDAQMEHGKLEAFKAGFDSRNSLDNEAIKVALAELEFYSNGYAEFLKDKGERAKVAIERIKEMFGLVL